MTIRNDIRKKLCSAVADYYDGYSWNQNRFFDKHISKQYALTMLKSNIAISGNAANLRASNSLTEFKILRFFNISSYIAAPPSIKEIICQHPSVGWVKINSDGAAKGFPGHSGGGFICRDDNGNVLHCMATYFGIKDPLYAEIKTVVLAIELASKKGWNSVWLELDSAITVDLFNGKGVVP
ncbi:unnamed protein product [Lupinus luteus]|uniref:RNase H type-1 domain-containing protein n=1 Tax=Lupinus luteus TaxID=3873 RepID=A0AAV1Y7M3_LUPLU